MFQFYQQVLPIIYKFWKHWQKIIENGHRSKKVIIKPLQIGPLNFDILWGPILCSLILCPTIIIIRAINEKRGTLKYFLSQEALNSRAMQRYSTESFFLGVFRTYLRLTITRYVSWNKCTNAFCQDTVMQKYPTNDVS